MSWYYIYTTWDRYIVGFCHKRRWITGHKLTCKVLMFLTGKAYLERREYDRI